MGKNIKDYLHLYIGCKVKCIESNQELLRVHALSTGTEITMTASKFFDVLIWHKSFKLILRPLSDMTEEEAKEVHNLTTGCKSKDGKDVISYYNTAPFLEPIEFLSLLSKHFDLFELIEAGLAIDKTKNL